MADEKSAEAIRDRNRRIREEAAEKRRTKRQAESAARRPTLGQLEASEIVDDALARTTHAVAGFLRKHFTIVQWVIVTTIVGGIGFQIYSHRRGKLEGQNTDALMAGVEQELARVGDGSPDIDPMTGISASRPTASSHDDRLRKAEAEYRKTADGEFGPLARMGLAGVLFDAGKHKEALAEYRRVRESPLAAEDTDLRARSLEGIGLTQEALGELDAAQKAFHELSNFDSAVLSALGYYHQGRLAVKKGDREKAKTHLLAALRKLSDAKVTSSYTELVTRELLATVDPSAVPAPVAPTISPADLARLKQSAGEGKDFSPEKLDELLKELAAQASASSAPSSAPAAPSAAPVAPSAAPPAPSAAKATPTPARAPTPAAPASAAPAPAPAPAAPSAAAPTAPAAPATAPADGGTP